MERQLWKIISEQITKLDRKTMKCSYTHTVGRIVRVYLWAALHDRPTYWACERDNWAGVSRLADLPDQSTMSRRLKSEDTAKFLDTLMEMLEPEVRQSVVYYLDGKAMTFNRGSIDTDSKFGFANGVISRGYKLHAIYAEKNRPASWSVTPLDRSEHKEAVELIDDEFPEGYVLADSGYDANHLYAHVSKRGGKLIARRRRKGAKGFGHRVHHEDRIDSLTRLRDYSPFLREALNKRKRVETRFAHLCNFGGGLTCLPPWVRRMHRVKLWVAAKMIIRIARDVRNREVRA